MFYFLFEKKCSGAVDCFISQNKETITILASIIASVAVILTFLFAIIQYRNAQRWKRNEFLVQKVEEFYDDAEVAKFFSMLDYHGKSFRFDENGSEKDLIVLHFKEDNVRKLENSFVEDLGTALHHHVDGPVNPAQEYIRNIFDTYCFYLQSFAILIKNKLFTVKELEPYIRYHVDLLNGMKSHSRGYHQQMFRYLVLYDQEWTLKLLDMFPQEIFIKKAIRDARTEKQTLVE